MVRTAILQVIDLNGGFQAYQLEPGRVIHVGQDPNNHIRLSGPNIAPFHLAVSSHEQGWEVITLSSLGTPLLNGLLLVPNLAKPLANGAVIRLAHYELRFFDSLPATLPEGGPWPQRRMPDAVRDRQQREIAASLVGLPAGSIVPVTPGQAVSFQLYIINQGQQYARFNVTTDGIPKGWISKLDSISVLPTEAGQMQVTITAPLEPKSATGDYDLEIWVAAQQYADEHRVRLPLKLRVLPFYRVRVSELRPRRRPLSWWASAARFHFELTNESNCNAQVRLQGEDSEDVCFFEFQLANGSDPTPRQIGETWLTLKGPTTQDTFITDWSPAAQRVWLYVTPQERPLFMRNRDYPFTITATSSAGDQETATRRGRVVQKPLVGRPLIFLALLLLLLSCAALVLHPRFYIWDFKVNNTVRASNVRAGEPVTLEWFTSPFIARARIKPGGDLITGQSMGTMMVTPQKETTAYVLVAESYLTSIFPGLRATRVVPVDMARATPQLELALSQTELNQGEGIEIEANVVDADRAGLVVDGTVIPFPSGEPQLKTTLVLDKDTVIELEAETEGELVTKQAVVAVATSTPTPTATPELRRFEFSSGQIVAGEPLQLDLALTTNDRVVLDPIGEIPAQASLSLFPQETTRYTLMTINPEGTPQILGVQEVTVDMPTPTPSPTPVPLAPTIVEFNASSRLVVLGKEEDDDDHRVVTLFWTVEGEVTDIHLLNKDGVVLYTNLPAVSQLDVLLGEENELFILEAFNKDETSRQSIPVEVRHAPIIYYFKADFFDTNDNFLGGCSTTRENYEDRRSCPYNDTTTKYIIISWSVIEATKVELESNVTDQNVTRLLGDQGPEGTIKLSRKDSMGNDITIDGGYTLKVKNDFGENRRKIRVCANAC